MKQLSTVLASVCALSLAAVDLRAETRPAPAKAAASASSALPLATPESQGMSSARLERMHAEMKRFVDEGKHAGVVTLVARNGRVVDVYSYGKRDLEAGLPMQPDTIVRMYSMSKIVTSVAALMLLEEARFKLDEPVSNYLPDLARVKVWTGGTVEKPILADARNPITIKQLLTHTSGLIYGFGDGPLDKIYRDANLGESVSLEDFVARVSRLPLAHEPGARFSYGFSTDVVGALVQKLSGKTFGAFCEERIFRPLRMRDTGFSIPASERGRLAVIYEKDKEGRLTPAKPVGGVVPDPGPKLEAGGMGLFSTAGDYARFLQMLLNGGTLDGTRLLSRKTVELMMANHLENLPRQTTEFNEYDGFGLGGAVVVNLARAGFPTSVGDFGWNGAATTRGRIDPKERLVTICLTQHFPFDGEGLFWRFATLVGASIAD